MPNVLRGFNSIDIAIMAASQEKQIFKAQVLILYRCVNGMYLLLYFVFFKNSLFQPISITMQQFKFGLFCVVFYLFGYYAVPEMYRTVTPKPKYMY